MDIIDITDAIVNGLDRRIGKGEFKTMSEIRIALREAANAYGNDSRVADWMDWMMAELRSRYILYCGEEGIVAAWY